ncbi:LOW QUALITY PROTEIN: Bicupin, oxalate decarboxylase/oxidase [Trema orientale]|uniref:Bicupin, oxalate decarboxylase/oxidase n=1 Tax=Trema orientale TaxID=63057 RepID=A0A2P5FYX9_TREOI|nr:LOW QUALITY PROTEIN: Bicupin, oxalate decarboxylase/oxidase [Trema orientale]
MKGVHFLLSLAVVALAASIASAYDPSPLQDFCVAVDDPNKALFVNGKFCKDPKLAKAEDFFTSGLNIPGDTNNKVGSSVTTVNVDKIPGLNTLGISLVRIDYAPYGQNPPVRSAVTLGSTTTPLGDAAQTLQVGLSTFLGREVIPRLVPTTQTQGLTKLSEGLQPRKHPSSCLCCSQQPKRRSHHHRKRGVWIRSSHQP